LAVMVGGISYGLLILYLGGPAQYLGNKATIVTVDGQGYLALGVSVIPIIFGVAVTRLVSTGLGRVVTLGLLLPLILFIGLSSDSKQQFLVPVLIIIIAVHYLRRRIRFTLILPFVLFVILAFPVFNAYRGVRELSDVPSTVTQVNITDFEFLTRSVMGRFYGIDALTYAVRDTPGVMDFQYGATLEPLIVAPVPRQVWSDKPTVSFARTFANTYFGKFFFGSGIFAAPSILGEGYINFALPGMLLVGLLSGLILRSAYGYFIVRGGGAPAVFAYSIIFVHLFKFWEADLAGLIVAATTSLLLALIAIALIGSRVASPEKVAAPLNRRASLGAG